jgi:hypothetical protein
MGNTYYIDFDSGDDNANGAEGTPWKTMTSGATAARIAPGDTIYMGKSPDPVLVDSSASWTHGSRTITLSAPLTQTVDNCENVWTASANVNPGTTDCRKQGSSAVCLDVTAAFTTGKAAYKTLLAELDLSAFTKLSFWLGSNVNIPTGGLSLRLCSDTAGDVTVDTIAIPALLPAAWSWYIPLCIGRTGGGSLGASIKSIALYVDSDFGGVAAYLDNIFATSGLSLVSLVSKTNLGSDGDEMWWPVASIDGTTLKLGRSIPDTEWQTYKGYNGDTETATLYRRETIKLPQVGTYAYHQVVNDSGTADANIWYRGGWDFTAHAQNGETWLDGQNGAGYGIVSVGMQGFSMERMGVVRTQEGFHFDSPGRQCTLTRLSASGNSLGLSTYYCQGVVYSHLRMSSCQYYPIVITTTANTKMVDIRCVDGQYYAIMVGGKRIHITDLVIEHNEYGIGLDSCQVFIRNLKSHGHWGTFHRFGDAWVSGDVTMDDAYIPSTNPYCNAHACVAGYGGDPTDNRIYTDYGFIRSYATDTYVSGLRWRLSPTDTLRNSAYPLDLELKPGIYCKAGDTYTFRAALRRDNAGLSAQLAIRFLQNPTLHGGADRTASLSGDTIGQWKVVTLEFSVDMDSVIVPQVECWGGSTYNLDCQVIPGSSIVWWGEPALLDGTTGPLRRVQVSPVLGG